VSEGPLTALVVEAHGHVTIPDTYLSPRGQLREGAPFCERDLRAPVFAESAEDAFGAPPYEVLVRNRGGWSALDHLHHPFDVVGWDGCLFPYAFDIADFEPIVGAVHQPPPVHQTFAGPGFVVCSFVPRPLDFWPGEAKVPYHHSNADSDELLFYSAGDYASRAGSGIGVGSISVHPSGFVHGPHPGAVEAAAEASATNELAVMVDTFHPLGFTELARSISDPSYPTTWSR
jgi:homogentisate 1,2-dioxygenase